MEERELRPPPPLAKRLAALITVLAILALGGAVSVRLAGALEEQAALEEDRREAADAAGAVAEVAVVRPSPERSAPVVVLTGTLEPAQVADLAFGVMGQVARVDVSLGDEVEEGDVLVTLDRASVGAQSAQSSAAIRVAEASAEMARDRVTLLERLVQAGTMPERDLITARQQLAVTEAQLEQARAGRQQIAATSAEHVLRAPFDGVVTRVPSGVGVAASPGVTLARVEDLSSLRLRTTINRSELEALEVGDEVHIDGSDAVGRLETVVRSLDTQTRRAPIEVLVPNADGALVGNALVRARVDVGQARSVLAIPATARRPDGTVLVVGEGARLDARRVIAEVAEDGRWLVTDGLTADDRVVIRPALVREGRVITPVEAAADPTVTARAAP